jgi:hypothetical protein
MRGWNTVGPGARRAGSFPLAGATAVLSSLILAAALTATPAPSGPGARPQPAAAAIPRSPVCYVPCSSRPCYATARRPFRPMRAIGRVGVGTLRAGWWTVTLPLRAFGCR